MGQHLKKVFEYEHLEDLSESCLDNVLFFISCSDEHIRENAAKIDKALLKTTIRSGFHQGVVLNVKETQWKKSRKYLIL